MFEKRMTGYEYLDSHEFDTHLAHKSYRFMHNVNRYLGGTRIVRNFIFSKIKEFNRPVEVLDMGSGTCDIPIEIAEEAALKGLEVNFTCIENHPAVLPLARKNISRFPDLNIELAECDVFQFHSPKKFDLATGTLFFHHFTDEKILELISKVHKLGCRSILINDLHRCMLCYWACSVAMMFSEHELKHDALTSILRGFKQRELEDMLSGIPGTEVVARAVPFCRIYAIINFSTEAR